MTTDEDHSDSPVVPPVSYFEKANDLIVAHDQLLASLFSAMIAGVVYLLLQEQVGFWVGAALFSALVLFVLGIGHTLLHMAFMSKMLLLLESLVNGTRFVPNALEFEELTAEAYTRNQAYAQRAYSAQLIYMFSGICCGGLAVVIHLWSYAWRSGLIFLLFFLALVAFASITFLWKSTVVHFMSRQRAARRQAMERAE